MDRIHIRLKDEFYTSYYENVIAWEFIDNFFKFTNDEGVHYVDTSVIKELLIGPMKEEDIKCTTV